METKANYVLVGIFTLIAIVAAFGFVYWTATVSDHGETAQLRVLIPGSASGLAAGSTVLFNGVPIGAVKRVYLAVNDPTIAIADTEIVRLTPITKSTQADIGIAGLTGQANIELRGANLKEPKLLEEAERTGTMAEITANPSAVTNLLETAQDIFKRADSVLDNLQGFVTDVRGPLTDTVNNAKKFSEALGENADGVDDFLASVTKLSQQLAGASDKLDSALEAAEGLLEIRGQGEGGADRRQCRKAQRQSQQSGQFGSRQPAGFRHRRARSAHRHHQQRQEILGGPRQQCRWRRRFSGERHRAFATAGRRLGQARIRRSTPPKGCSNLWTRRKSRRSSTMSKSSAAISVRPAIRSTASSGVSMERSNRSPNSPMAPARRWPRSKRSSTVSTPRRCERPSKTSSRRPTNAKQVVEDVSKVTTKIGARANDIDQIVADAHELADRLNQASTRVDGILVKVDSLLGSDDAKGLAVEASETLKSFKQVADTLNSRLGTITDGLARFTNQGLREVEGLVRDSRRSINRIEEAVTDLGRNPQRIITGGEGQVRQFNGRARR